MLAYACAVVGVAWVIDMSTGFGAPATTRAATASLQNGAPPIPPDPPDRAQLETFLASSSNEYPPLDIAADVRDPFRLVVPPAPPSAAASDTAPTVTATVATAVSGSNAVVAPAISAEEFTRSHPLHGVILGRAPHALIGNSGYQVGDSIDGYRIVAIRRDTVVLRKGRSTLVLHVPRPEIGSGRR